MKIEHYTTGPIFVNTYLVYDEESKKGFVVDPGGYSGKLANSVREKGLSIDYIILTHGHADHIGGVAEHLKEFSNCKIVSYIDEDDILLDAKHNESTGILGRPVTIDSDIKVNDMDTMSVGNMNLTFIHTPGHTPGGMCIYVDNVLFSGDTLFRFSIGRTDFYGGSFKDISNSIKTRLYTLPDDTLVLPGHESSTTIGDEKKGNPFV